MATLVVDANYSADALANGTKASGGGNALVGDFGNDRFGTNGTPGRCVFRFSISSIPSGSTVTQVDLQVENNRAGDAGASWRIGPYNGDGLADPSPDSGSTIYSRCNLASDNYQTGLTAFRTTGSKSFTSLGSAANSDLQAAISGGIFSIALQQEQENGFWNWADITDHTGTDKPTLTVTYTPPAGGLMMMVCYG